MVDERDLAVAIRKGDYSKCRKALVKAIGTEEGAWHRDVVYSVWG